MRPLSHDIWIRNIDYGQITGEETSKREMESLMLGLGTGNRTRATWNREMANVEDILSRIKRNKGQCAGHICKGAV